MPRDRDRCQRRQRQLDAEQSDRDEHVPGGPGEPLTVNGGTGDTNFSAQVNGNFAADLTLLNVAAITAFTIAGDLSGQVDDSTPPSTPCRSATR